MLRKALTTTLLLSAAVSLSACGGSDDSSASATCENVDLPEDLGIQGNVEWISKFAEARNAGTCLTAADARAFVDTYKSTQDTTTEDDAPSNTPAPTLQDNSTSESLGSTKRGSASQMDERSVEQRKIFRDSETFSYLNEKGGIQPGSKYIIQHADGSSGSCSFGWTVGPKNDRSEIYNLTAGHCGKTGDKVYAFTEQGESVHVGQFVMSQYDETSEALSSGRDYALIKFNSNAINIPGTPNVTAGGSPLKLAGWTDSQWLEENNPYICRMGWRSGLSCGQFQKMVSDTTMVYDNISDRGDSGGVIWAVDPKDPSQTTIYAVGVASFLTMTDATSAGGKVIGPVMEENNLTIYS